VVSPIVSTTYELIAYGWRLAAAGCRLISERGSPRLPFPCPDRPRPVL